jgi:hypothetical protein
MLIVRLATTCTSVTKCKKLVLPGYGHQDLFWGKNPAAGVHPAMPQALQTLFLIISSQLVKTFSLCSYSRDISPDQLTNYAILPPTPKSNFLVP